MIDRGVWWMVVDAYIGTFLIKTGGATPKYMQCEPVKSIHTLHCNCLISLRSLGVKSILYLYICLYNICFVLLLYLYCIAVDWVEKLQIALTPLGTPKAARWQLSAIKGSTNILL